MDQFWLEFINHNAYMLALLVSGSSAGLFYLIQRVERSVDSFWRPLGFFFLTVGFFLYIIERRFTSASTIAVMFEALGFFSIYIGVRTEPDLLKIGSSIRDTDIKPHKLVLRKNVRKLLLPSLVLMGIVFFVAVTPKILNKLNNDPLIANFFIIISIMFISVTLYLQIKRYIDKKDNINAAVYFLYPLIAWMFLLFRDIALFLYNLPENNIVFLQDFSFAFGRAWQASIAFTFLAFIFLAMWIWEFIKPRFYLRTIVSFLTVSVVVSTLGSFIFTILTFTIVEKNNLQTLEEAAQTQHLIMEDRSNTGLILARTIASDPELANSVVTDEYYDLLDSSEDQLLISGVDIYRIYDSSGTVVASPSDEREQNEYFGDDKYVKYVLENNSPISTFDLEDHVLAPLIISRGIYPITKGNKTIGAIEIGYRFDNAFVDFSKTRTGLDTSVYSGDTRSATTIYRLDGVSRWIGTKESDQEILDAVLEEGLTFKISHEQLGRLYYTAFVPIRESEGDVIGMVSVGNVTAELIESARQQLLNSFLILSFLSLFAGGAGYLALKNYSLESIRI